MPETYVRRLFPRNQVPTYTPDSLLHALEGSRYSHKTAQQLTNSLLRLGPFINRPPGLRARDNHVAPMLLVQIPLGTSHRVDKPALQSKQLDKEVRNGRQLVKQP